MGSFLFSNVKSPLGKTTFQAGSKESSTVGTFRMATPESVDKNFFFSV